MSPEGSKEPPLIAATDDRRAIHPLQLRALLQMQLNPTAYVQRVCERLRFLPGGGQHWQRDVQLRLPSDPTLSGGEHKHPPRTQPTMQPEFKELFLVSLGMFKRARFADFTVRDGAGNRISLLTRFQHGYCLASAMILKFLTPSQMKALSGHQDAYDGLYLLLFDLLTSVELTADCEPAAFAFTELLEKVGAAPEAIEEKREKFIAEYAAMQTVTQYMCWVFAEPGEMISLTATYTMADPPEIHCAEPVAAASAEVEDEPSLAERLRARWEPHRISLAIRRTRLYSSTGLGPLNYELNTPANDHAGSYYFLLEPPESCRVSYLDWGLGNSIDDRDSEVDCAYDSVHIHNGSTHPTGTAPARLHASIAGSTITAFLRAEVRDQWPLLIAAALTMLLAFLAERGQFVSQGGDVSSILLIAPSALLAYIAQRQSHHYAEATRWLGPLLIVYLFANIVFVASVRYDVLGGDTFFGRPNALDDMISAALEIASAALIFWFLAIAARERFIERWFLRKEEPENTVDLYSELGLRYGDRAMAALIVGVVAVIAAAVLFSGIGWGDGRESATIRQEKNGPGTAEAEPPSRVLIARPEVRFTTAPWSRSRPDSHGRSPAAPPR
jgi:hypothetical protein